MNGAHGILDIISNSWVSINIIVLFLIFTESRYPKKKQILLSLLISAIIIGIKFSLFFFTPDGSFARSLINLTNVPLLFLFMFISKYRDFKFVFNIFLVSTFGLAISIATTLIANYVLGGDALFSFIARVVIFLAVEIALIAKPRKIFFLIRENVKHGWLWFSLVSAVFYVLLYVMINYPMRITLHTDTIPETLILLCLLPLTYFNIFQLLYQQYTIYTVKLQTDIYELEKAHITDIVNQNAKAEERLRIERHDLRHRMKSLYSMIENEEYENAKEYIRTSTAYFEQQKTARYCQNPILNAVFSTYYSEAKRAGIKIESQLAIPNDISVNPTEFSIVIANAIENAIISCQKLPEDQRKIRCKYVTSPKHMFQIANTYKGHIKFDSDGNPISTEKGHGIGTRSIMAFCEKYNAEIDYKTIDGWFYLRIVF